MTRLFKSFAALPRSAKWIVGAVVVCAVYFLAIEPVLERTNALASDADSLEKSLARSSEIGSESSDDGRVILTASRFFGKPKLPTDPSARPESIQRIVDEVLENNHVEGPNKIERSSSLNGDYLSILKPGEGNIERYIVEVSFDATQETVAHVIADLERSPSVSAISRVKIDRSGTYSAPTRDSAGNESSGPRFVRAIISAESWVFVPRTSGEFSDGGDQ